MKTKPTTAVAENPVSKSISSNRMQQILFFVCMLIPSLLLLNKVNEYAVNIPMKDDYDAILNFICDFKDADILHKVQLMFSQHNEHRIFTSRIFYVAYFLLTGTVNFRFFTFLAFLQLIPIFFVIGHFMKKFSPSYWYISAAILGLCLFDLSYYENNIMAMAGIQNFGVIMWFVLGLYFYSRDKKRDIWFGAICQALCIFSSGNGILGALIISITTLFLNNKPKIIVSGAVFLVFTGLYFLNYVSPASSEHEVSSINSIVPFFMHMLGGHFGFENGEYYGALILILLLVSFPITRKLKIQPGAIPLIGILVFALVSISMTAIYRSSGPLLLSYSSRYLIYPGIITAILFCFLEHRLTSKKIYWPVVIGCMLLLLNAYKENYDYGIAGFEREHTRLQRYEYYYFPERVETAKQIASRSCSMQIYCINEER